MMGNQPVPPSENHLAGGPRCREKAKPSGEPNKSNLPVFLNGDVLQTGWHSSQRILPGSLRHRPTNQRARRATSIQTPPLACSDWPETTGFHGERDGIPMTGDHWFRELSIVLYKQAFHRTWSPMLSVWCGVRPGLSSSYESAGNKTRCQVLKLHKCKRFEAEATQRNDWCRATLFVVNKSR